jgi:hypothetical protein
MSFRLHFDFSFVSFFDFVFLFASFARLVVVSKTHALSNCRTYLPSNIHQDGS